METARNEKTWEMNRFMAEFYRQLKQYDKNLNCWYFACQAIHARLDEALKEIITTAQNHGKEIDIHHLFCTELRHMIYDEAFLFDGHTHRKNKKFDPANIDFKGLKQFATLMEVEFELKDQIMPMILSPLSHELGYMSCDLYARIDQFFVHYCGIKIDWQDQVIQKALQENLEQRLKMLGSYVEQKVANWKNIEECADMCITWTNIVLDFAKIHNIELDGTSAARQGLYECFRIRELEGCLKATTLLETIVLPALGFKTDRTYNDLYCWIVQNTH